MKTITIQIGNSDDKLTQAERALYPDDLRELRERLEDEVGEHGICKKTLMAVEVIALAIMVENEAEGEKPDGRD